MRIGIPDGSPGTRNMNCPGAYMVLTLEQFRELEQLGVHFASDGTDIPAEGKGYARVFCCAEVQTVKRPHGTYAMGLCSHCSELERNQRRQLKPKTP
jgi:hypothetical protein